MPLRSHKRALFAGVGGAVALLAAVLVPSYAGASATAPKTVKLTGQALGMNIPMWDALYANSAPTKVIQNYLKAAHVTQLSYGGGTVADYYDWQTNKDIQSCLPNSSPAEYNAKCAVHLLLPFSLYSQRARAIGAQTFVMVNYGSGTPAEAAAWVKQAKKNPSQNVALWQIGNENYGCWEVNNELAEAPANYKGYNIDVNNSCPMVKEGLDAGMATMAESYAAHARQFMTAMKAANPSAQLGVPWAFDSTVGGASVADNTEWNDTVLGSDAKYISFVDAHWYPFGFGGSTGGANPTDEQVLQSLFEIPTEYGNVRTTLNQYDPSAKIVVGETGVSYLATTIACTPVGALFSAGDALSWLSLGAESIDWWQLNSYGNTGSTCTKPDEGMFTSSGSKPVPESYYWGYQLAGELAQKNAHLSQLQTSDPADVLAFQSVLPNGKVVVALINTNTTSARTVTFTSSLSGKLTKQSYSAGNQNAAKSKIVTSTITAASLAGGLVLPRESMIVLQG